MLIKNTRAIIYLQASMYLAGIIGLSISSTQAFFQLLTPFHLLSSFIFLIITQDKRNTAFWQFVLTAVSLGYFVEVLGVKTQMIFGAYQYQTTLGFKIFEVPPMIGINWFLMVFCAGVLIDQTFKSDKNIILKSTFGATILTIFDYIAEPVAIDQNMWTWTFGVPPLQNYIAWFLVAFVLLFAFFRLKFTKNNPLAIALFIFQLIFFGVLRFLIYLQG
ncbi:carotenoid biosynthesis protein [Lacihabitans soyangensis]|uniref:Carotenoid biosynthesis protein n=1 Tax=Lacihabitans soyangensis TaxID=869394 RepID=A0AAE3H5G5_9BACT|nr:carotenoid biosynthesis protein [Lacihabitans soyangensis]MCP9764354.1 carotenoid biosynthesis protein [Lacihabitans soyangensis]